MHKAKKRGEQAVTGLFYLGCMGLYKIATKGLRKYQDGKGPFPRWSNERLKGGLCNLAADIRSGLIKTGPLPAEVQDALDYYKEHGVGQEET